MNSANPHLTCLAGQHDRIVGIVDGLDEAQVRSGVLPSGWSPLGMIVHVREGARFWLLEVMLGQHPTTPVSNDFEAPTGIDTAQTIDSFRAETSQALSAVAALPLDAVPAWWPVGEWGGWRLNTFQEVLLHLLMETACHAGHLDAARELIDGATWDYATDQARHQAQPSNS
jgi:hypothetical protein